MEDYPALGYMSAQRSDCESISYSYYKDIIDELS
jgi:hypothetical protein